MRRLRRCCSRLRRASEESDCLRELFISEQAEEIGILLRSMSV